MAKLPAQALVLIVLSNAAASAQVSSGSIAGTIRDPLGAGIPHATVLIVNGETGLSRKVIASERGDFTAPGLPPGVYRVIAQAPGFKRVDQSILVQVGATSVSDLTLPVGDVSETITVARTPPLLNRDRHQVDGVVTRTQIESLPLNGRSFLELAKLEPGVTSPVRGTSNRTFLGVLGSGFGAIPRVGNARVTMDGASLAAIGGIGTVMQVSQEAVDEFQIAAVNFDVATGQTSNGAANIVTRSGGNRVLGTGFVFYRDHHIAAYPAPVNDPANPDPLFRRTQSGVSIGGPIRRNRAFFFGSYERTQQLGVVGVFPSAPEFASLGGIFPTRLSGDLLTIRIDMRPHARHHVVLRHSHDDNRAFAQTGNVPLLPSAFSRMANRVGQSLAAVTSTVSNRVVNDARFSVLTLETAESPAGPDDCGGCFGLDAPRTTVSGTGLTFGRARLATQEAWRAQLTNDLSWTMAGHQLRLGFNWEHASSASMLIDREPAQLVLWSPQQVRAFDGTIPLPASFTTAEDVFQLPLRSFTTAVGSDVNLQKDFRNVRILDALRLYAGDSWRVSPRWTINTGLAWTYEPNVLNDDLTKPEFLTPILGADRLGPPDARPTGFWPIVGWTWIATKDGKTLVRGGAGRYSDGTAWANGVHILNERRYLMPLGNGRFPISGANFQCDGRTFDFRRPTTTTGQQLLDVLPACRSELERALTPGNQDFSFRNLNRAKEGNNLSDPDYDAPSALHGALGVQRELGFGVVASADIVYKSFTHTFLNGIDYNRFYSAAGPVIPACTASQRSDDRAACSNGPIFFDTTAGRARYRGLLVRAERRLSDGWQLLASYALGSFRGTNGAGTPANSGGSPTAEGTGGRPTGFNNDAWFENDGPLPTDLRHVFNVSGTVTAPWRVEVAFSVSAHSRPPFSAYVLNLDFNGDGTWDDLLPGTRVNRFGRGLGKDDLARLVDAYNRDVNGRVFTVRGTQIAAPPLALPASYEFNDNFFTADLRIGRSFAIGAPTRRLFLFAEVFNLFNTRNLVDYGMDLSDPTTFGQPGGSFTQVFGSGGPRAAQVGARLRF